MATGAGAKAAAEAISEAKATNFILKYFFCECIEKVGGAGGRPGVSEGQKEAKAIYIEVVSWEKRQ